MFLYSLKRVQRLPISLDEAWVFFSDPGNLSKITPEYMQLNVTSDPEFLQHMYAGQIITYTVRPLLNIPLFWMTEIKHVQPGAFFVDEQRMGPYVMWHHQHHFKTIPGGVEMTDLVHYKLPLGPLGALAKWLFVGRQLDGIFNYRFAKLEERYGRLATSPLPASEAVGEEK
ncbi:MAG: SRPBCC family protein [Saprospiraceae bacterium]|nr:SRPBCC family protein [Saprospiraceae bacterium]